MEQFARCFYHSDVLLVTEIYAASETPIPGVTGERLSQEIASHGHHDLHFCETVESALSRLVELVKPGDAVITLGAGNIWQVGEWLLAKLKSSGGSGGTGELK